MLSSCQYFICEDTGGQATVDIFRCGDGKDVLEVAYELERAPNGLKGGKGSATFEPKRFSQSVVLEFAFGEVWQPNEAFIFRIRLKSGNATIGCSSAKVHIVHSKKFPQKNIGGSREGIQNVLSKVHDQHGRQRAEYAQMRANWNAIASFLKDRWVARGKQVSFTACVTAEHQPFGLTARSYAAITDRSAMILHELCADLHVCGVRHLSGFPSKLCGLHRQLLDHQVRGLEAASAPPISRTT
jgi:hypothetical protein